MNRAATITADAAERAVLDAADGLFYGRGIAGVSMSEIRDGAQVSMRRLYMLYPSKRDLVAGWLEDRHLRWMAWFTDATDRHARSGTDAVLATFDALAEWVSAPGYRGCAFLNSVAEIDEIDDLHRTIIAAHKRSLIEHVAALALADRPDAPEWLPAAMGVLIDGAIVQSAVFGSSAPVAAAREAAAHLIGATS